MGPAPAAGSRGAALAIERVDHEHGRIERAFEIGIVEHDHGVLAAKLEMHALQARRALAMIAEPVELSPTKPMALISGCSVSALPASSPMPLTRLHTPLGRPLPSAIRQQARRQRRKFGRLVHNGAACREGRGDLPGRQHERRVPRRDDADRTDGHPGRDVPVLLARHVEAIAGFGASSAK